MQVCIQVSSGSTDMSDLTSTVKSCMQLVWLTRFVTLLYTSLNVMSIRQHHRPVRAHLSRQLRNKLSLASWRHQNFVQKAIQIQNKATPLLGTPHKMAATFTHKLRSQPTKVIGWLISLTAGRTESHFVHSTKNNHSKQVYNNVPSMCKIVAYNANK